MRTLRIEPVTRVEGHLGVELDVETAGGANRVADARVSGTMFRGIETILIGRDPRDATHYTQRICGICPVAHGVASSLALENALGLAPPDNGRVLRNLVQGANILQSHLLHFYHLAALDYVDTTGLLDAAPWTPGGAAPDKIKGDAARPLVTHILDALTHRRKAHQMGAIFGSKLPCSPALVPGGCTGPVTPQKIEDFRALLAEVRSFIDNVYVPDVLEIVRLFPQYKGIGKGCGNLLSLGAFDLDGSGTARLFARGRVTDGQTLAVDAGQIKEYVKHSRYSAASGDRGPPTGVTEPDGRKAGAYSWIKAPRYLDAPHEVGPLARMWVSGDYREGISVADRLLARALEAKKIAGALGDWLDRLVPGAATYTHKDMPGAATGIGLTEAARGALGHWVQVEAGKILRYQIVTPTAWNASPMDDRGRKGPMEQALVGTPLADPDNPVEALRVIHSFDPCLGCAVHVVRLDGRRPTPR